MVVGCLGEIPFTVSSEAIQTLQNMVWSGSAQYGTHDRHLHGSLTEFTGSNPDGYTFDIVLSAFLGVNPMDSITELWTYERTGRAVPLVVGTHAYGEYRWTVLSHKIKVTTCDADGDILTATVSVTLQGYLRG